MRLFQPTAGVKVRLVLCIMAGLALMATDKHYDHLSNVRNLIAQGLYPLEVAVQVPSQLTQKASKLVQNHLDLLQQNQSLKSENLRLMARLQRFQSLESENFRLRALLQSSERLEQRVLVSELLGMDLDPFRQHLRIDKGERQGAFVGQPVIDARGVMGQIISTTKESSNVLLISDPNHVTPVEILRNGLRTVAAGTGQADMLRLRYLPDHSDIKIGDELVTSGLGGRFPADYPVATVVKIRKVPGAPFLEIFAKPRAFLDRAREVLLVWGERSTGQVDFAGDPSSATVRTQ